jgi:hypothetical protein
VRRRAAHRSSTVSGNGTDRFLLMERAFRFRSNGTERNENVTVFLTPTVWRSLPTQFEYTGSIQLIGNHTHSHPIWEIIVHPI